MDETQKLAFAERVASLVKEVLDKKILPPHVYLVSIVSSLLYGNLQAGKGTEEELIGDIKGVFSHIELIYEPLMRAIKQEEKKEVCDEK